LSNNGPREHPTIIGDVDELRSHFFCWISVYELVSLEALREEAAAGRAPSFSQKFHSKQHFHNLVKQVIS
jgi:hypothetical protein